MQIFPQSRAKNHEETQEEKEKETTMNKISRKGFLKIAAAAAMSGVTAGALSACNAASGSVSYTHLTLPTKLEV